MRAGRPLAPLPKGRRQNAFTTSQRWRNLGSSGSQSAPNAGDDNQDGDPVEGLMPMNFGRRSRIALG
jgi:hypothetical protein